MILHQGQVPVINYVAVCVKVTRQLTCYIVVYVKVKRPVTRVRRVRRASTVKASVTAS